MTIAIILTKILLGSRWKVAVCVCVCLWLKLKQAFSTCSLALKCSFPMRNALVSSGKSVHPHHETHLLLAIKHVQLQCDSYLEVSSRDFLIASDEHAHMQCEIIFRDR